jgi:hypothetical protein
VSGLCEKENNDEKIKSNNKMCLKYMSLRVTPNDLHASDGRDTEALNCKPITNL